MGLLNMDSDKVCEINIPRQPEIYFELVRDRDDNSEEAVEYLIE